MPISSGTLSVNFSTFDYFYELGTKAYLEGRYADAATFFDSAYSISYYSPNDAKEKYLEALFKKATAESKLGDKTTALWSVEYLLREAAKINKD